MATTIRPGAVTAIAVINIVVGSFGLLGECCCGGYFGFVAWALHNMPAPKPGEPDVQALFTNIDQKHPFLKVYLIAGFSISVLLTLLLLISSFGLLKMKTWGRSLSVFASIGFILLFVANAIAYFALNMTAIQNDFLNGYDQLQKDMNKKNPAAGPPQQMPVLNPTAGAVSNIIQTLIYCSYPVIVIWILFLPSVRRAFAVARGELAPATEEPEDYRDPPRNEPTNDQA
ncbi:MAG TPA: hypothetical protein VGZ47_22320 [Gemmataceae bacterium]|jgi:hypothetical protein|nr:hypothetical protein [Gemmataceae bacterium]